MCSSRPYNFYGDRSSLHVKKCDYKTSHKVRFCHNISFWPYLMHFWAVSLQNRLKMWIFKEYLKPVVVGLWQLIHFEKHATTTSASRSSLVWFFGFFLQNQNWTGPRNPLNLKKPVFISPNWLRLVLEQIHQKQV